LFFKRTFGQHLLGTSKELEPETKRFVFGDFMRDSVKSSSLFFPRGAEEN